MVIGVNIYIYIYTYIHTYIYIYIYIYQNFKGWSVIYEHWRRFLTFPKTLREVRVIFPNGNVKFSLSLRLVSYTPSAS